MKTYSRAKPATLIALLTLATVSWAEAQYSPNRPGQTNQPTRVEPDRSGRTQDRAETYQTDQPQKVNKASTLIGMKVENASGEKLGTIKEIVLDLDSAKVAYCVLSVDGGILKSERLHAVPLDAFRRNAEGDALTLNADKANLVQAEGFNRDAWPSVQNPSWGAEPIWKKQGDHDKYGNDKHEKEKLNQTDPSKPVSTPEQPR